MSEIKVGEVVKFYAKPGVAAIKVTEGTLHVGDTVRFKGYTTDFKEEIQSMQIENETAEKAEAGQLVGIKVKDRVRGGDTVYKVVDED
ncbi:MAG: EF-Tu/IF-2/RF-3 family GTPase [Thermodesulfobacteriota bacterium]|nr:EF-Tu/IF-2/RF-3 family GTPase [Thermodesulfobacteriota bacterium]